MRERIRTRTRARPKPSRSGFVPRSECGFAGERTLTTHFTEGEPVSVRVVSVDTRAQRLLLSFLHTDGSRIASEEATYSQDAAPMLSEKATRPPAGTDLGELLRRAMDQKTDA